MNLRKLSADDEKVLREYLALTVRASALTKVQMLSKYWRVAFLGLMTASVGCGKSESLDPIIPRSTDVNTPSKDAGENSPDSMIESAYRHL